MSANLALRDAIATLREAGIEDAPRDARLLMARALGIDASRLTLHLQDPLNPAAAEAFAALVKTRATRQPMAQILGERLFWGHSFEVTRDTLDPRPETETLVAEALRRPFVKMLDLGTGTGCILISCLLGMPAAAGLGTDLSPLALAVAHRNAARHGLASSLTPEPMRGRAPGQAPGQVPVLPAGLARAPTPDLAPDLPSDLPPDLAPDPAREPTRPGTGRARFAISDWFSAVPERFDLIVSNPPYIAEAELPALSPEVRDWEPLAALTPGGDGLDAYRTIAAGAPARLIPGGRLLLEIGPSQGQAVLALLAAQGLTDLRILPDLDGRDRVVCGQKVAGAGNSAGN